MPASRPNILFIVVDDCGYADLGCTGQTDYRTPALDRLAAEGVRFTQAYANSALCTNTRVALAERGEATHLTHGRCHGQRSRWRTSSAAAGRRGVRPMPAT